MKNAKYRHCIITRISGILDHESGTWVQGVPVWSAENHVSESFIAVLVNSQKEKDGDIFCDIESHSPLAFPCV